jgi:hypothetical protein
MSDKDQRKLIWFVLVTLWIKALWTLHPDALLPNADIPTYKMFPFSDILITKPSYFYFICLHAITMIYVFVWGEVFKSYRNLFKIWFIIQAVQFVEYFFNYNEAQLWTFIGPYKLDIDLVFLKMVGLPVVFLLYNVIWNRNR